MDSAGAVCAKAGPRGRRFQLGCVAERDRRAGQAADLSAPANRPRVDPARARRAQCQRAAGEPSDLPFGRGGQPPDWQHYVRRILIRWRSSLSGRRYRPRLFVLGVFRDYAVLDALLLTRPFPVAMTAAALPKGSGTGVSGGAVLVS